MNAPSFSSASLYVVSGGAFGSWLRFAAGRGTGLLLGPERASMFFNLIPLFTAVIAAAVLGERLSAYHAVGGALTVAGVLLAELWKTPLRARRTPRSPAGSTPSAPA